MASGASRHGLVIGVDYADPKLRLPGAPVDAQAIYNLMIDPQCGLFPKENVRLLLNEQATFRNIRMELSLEEAGLCLHILDEGPQNEVERNVAEEFENFVEKRIRFTTFKCLVQLAMAVRTGNRVSESVNDAADPGTEVGKARRQLAELEVQIQAAREELAGVEKQMLHLSSKQPPSAETPALSTVKDIRGCGESSCPACLKSLPCEQWMLHETWHDSHGRATYRCPNCQRITELIGTQFARRIEGPPDSIANADQTCALCGHRLSGADWMRRIVARFQNGQGFYHCPNCNRIGELEPVVAAAP
ncbi:MAG: hypothetical protein GX456_06845 [Verrucomicrobia bacterium]|nr:hypothetical protein [Verrucomicrobiota bacterium]